MAKHRAPRRLTARRAATPVAALALSAAALTAVAPMASAHTRLDGRDGPSGNGNIGLLNDLTLLPVNACGLQVPILGSILAAPTPTCSNTHG
ncbi:hypothetical protein [Actinomycetospora chiangmaiensis]|uniref:hypothetical protein n=1 Tax=Actinomycetospora chiangmaiensis TaxID=402650 RepID=UPI00035FDC14|nr:hypothetical protein [Actinomycetospora chiangmaiensis]